MTDRLAATPVKLNYFGIMILVPSPEPGPTRSPMLTFAQATKKL